MGNALIAYLAAAVAAASHAAAPPHGATAALAARPLHGSVVLRAGPGGKALVRVGPRGPLGGPLVLGVVGVRGRWVEVTAEALPNGHHGWVRFGRDVSVQPLEWMLRASLSRRELYVLRGGRLVRTIPVGIGAPDSPTPTGHFAVAEKVEALYDAPKTLPAGAEGSEMRKLRAQMHQRMLGNGYCARPVGLDCHFESICESCTFFQTTIEFRPASPARRRRRQGPGRAQENLRRTAVPPR